MTISKNLVNLCWLKVQAQNSNVDFGIILDDDILYNNILLLKKGTNLNDYLIDKLLNFGIKEAFVNITDLEKSSVKTEITDYDLIKNQSILVINEDLKEISKILRILPKAGFKEQNIFAIANLEILDRYIMKKNLFYIFIDHTFFNQSLINMLSQLNIKQYLNIFILGAETFKEIRNLKELKVNNNFINIKILQKPLDSGYIKALINLCPSSKFKQLLERSDDLNASAC
ncbi:MAG: hypothetical protein WC197_07480 [Candidatus Gastranaerophilaceae bacterium]|jgi:hypothetical protein